METGVDSSPHRDPAPSPVRDFSTASNKTVPPTSFPYTCALRCPQRELVLTPHPHPWQDAGLHRAALYNKLSSHTYPGIPTVVPENTSSVEEGGSHLQSEWPRLLEGIKIEQAFP